MKKILFALIVTTVLFGCSSDDSPPTSENYETLIIGKWKYVERGKIVDGQEVPQPLYVFNHIDYSYCVESYINFLTTNIYQGTVIICPNDALLENVFRSGNGTWEIEGNNLHNRYSDLHFIYKIKELNTNTLNLQEVSGGSIYYHIYNKVN